MTFRRIWEKFNPPKYKYLYELNKDAFRYGRLANDIEGYSPRTIQLVYDTLRKYQSEGNKDCSFSSGTNRTTATIHFADHIREILTSLNNEKNFCEALKVLYTHIKEEHSGFNLADGIEEIAKDRDIEKAHHPLIFEILQTAARDKHAHKLANQLWATLRYLPKESRHSVLQELLKHAKKGGDPLAMATLFREMAELDENAFNPKLKEIQRARKRLVTEARGNQGKRTREIVLAFKRILGGTWTK